MDTRFWGPSGWQLLHLIAFKSPHPEQFLLGIKDILPCRFCRESAIKFTQKLAMGNDPGRWLYKFHNMVNDKLRKQSYEDPKVVDPGPDPSFENVKRHYASLKQTDVPGRDFLFSIAVNYPDDPNPQQMAVQRVFIKQLSEVYPFEPLRTTFQSYLCKNEVTLENHKTYTRWMHGLLSALAHRADTSILPYNSYLRRVSAFKSGCTKKKFKGKTCRRKTHRKIKQ